MIAVMLRLVVQPNSRDEITRRVRDDLMDATRREAGCIRYRFYQDVEDPNAFSFVEHWQDWASLNAHFRSEHVGGFLEALPAMLAQEPEAFFQEVVNSRGLEAVAEARQQLAGPSA